MSIHPCGWSKKHHALRVPPRVCFLAVVNDPDLPGCHRARYACLGLLQGQFSLRLEADMIGLGTNPLMEVVPVTVEDVGARDLSLCLRRVDEGLQLLPGDELGLLDFEWLPPFANLASDHSTTGVCHDVLEFVFPV